MGLAATWYLLAGGVLAVVVLVGDCLVGRRALRPIPARATAESDYRQPPSRVLGRDRPRGRRLAPVSARWARHESAAG